MHVCVHACVVFGATKKQCVRDPFVHLYDLCVYELTFEYTCIHDSAC